MSEIPKKKVDDANKEILKYSLLAMGSSLVPGKEFDPLVDSALQYKMIVELEDIYEVKNGITIQKFVSVIIDNFAWKVVGSKITGFTKYLPPPFNTAAALQVAWDFVTTFAIGHTFRKVFEHAHKNNIEPNMSNIADLVLESLIEGKEYFIRNFTTILGMSKITLEKLDIDIDKVAADGKKIFDSQDELTKEFHEIIAATKKAVHDLGSTQADFDKTMDELVKKNDTPSIEMLEAELNIRELNGEDVGDLRTFLNNLKNIAS